MANVVVRFIGDASQLTAEMRKVEGTGNKLKTFAKGVGAAIGAGLAFKFGADAVKSAEQLQATIAQVGRTFGASRGVVEDWAKGAATSIGQPESVALKAAQQFGLMARGMGASAPEAAKMSTSMATLAANLAAAKGVPFADALQAISTGLKGRALQLKTFGISLDNASIKQEAMRLGLLKQGGTLSTAAKLQASYSLITRQGASAQGAYAKFAGTAAGQQQQLHAQIENGKDALGSALLPVLRIVLPILVTLGKLFAENAHVLAPLAVAIGIATAATWLWNLALEANPIVQVVTVIGLLVAGVILAYQHFAFFRDAVNAVWSAIQIGFAWIVGHWPLLLTIMLGPFGLLVALVIKNFGTILSIIEGVFNWIVAHWQLLLIILTGPIGLAVVLIVRYWNLIWSGLQIVFNAIMVGVRFFAAVFRLVWEGIRLYFAAWVAYVRLIFAGVAIVWNGLKTAASGVVGFVKDRWNDLLSFMRGLVGGFANVGRSIANALKAPINAFIDFWNGFEFPSVTLPFGGGTIGGGGLPHISKLAAGGIITRPTLALVGEAGPEAVVPLGSGGVGTTYNVNVNVSAGTDPSRVGAQIVDAIKAYEHANGARWRSAS